MLQHLNRLEWPLLLSKLAEYCHSDDARERCLNLTPNLPEQEVLARWDITASLRQLISQNYRAPVGNLTRTKHVFKSAKLGQILHGTDLRLVAQLLESSRNVHAFASDLASRSIVLAKVKGQIYPMPQLYAAIQKAVGPEGQILDTASAALQKLRQQKVNLKKRIEEQIKKTLQEGEWAAYLQDDFFTVRHERYVVPIRLDGRGRVRGTIVDTSDSGQTLFIEPATIGQLNDQLQELELEEKLEIIRIFRDFSQKIAQESDVLTNNYDQLIELDFNSAQAQLAYHLDAGPAKIVNKPVLSLRDVRHPLLMTHSSEDSNSRKVVANDIVLKNDQNVLMISGPNAGGKTVVLKTVGLIHLMAKAGLLLPLAEESEIYLFDHIFVAMGDAQNLTANLSTFSGHLLELKPILEKARGHDLVLLDELAVGTDPETGCALAQALLEHLAEHQVVSLVTTHFDSLKSLAVQNKRFRNGAMEFSLKSLRPTYKLILDVPGQSYGIEVAEQLGLPPDIIERAKELRGHSFSNLDSAVMQLMQVRDETRSELEQLQAAQMEAQAEKLRWQQEKELLKEARNKNAAELNELYKERLSESRRELDELMRQLRQMQKGARADQSNQSHGTGPDHAETLQLKHLAEQQLRNLDTTLTELSKNFHKNEDLPGKVAASKEISKGTHVYVIPLKKEGMINKPVEGSMDVYEVEIGVLKLRIPLHDLRIISDPVNDKSSSHKGQKVVKPASTSLTTDTAKSPAGQFTTTQEQLSHEKTKKISKKVTFDYVPQTSTNSVDLRGLDADSAITKAWNFIDRSLMRGEPAIVLIHGHGTDTLKRSIREALSKNCPYDISFRPGNDQEGGDGVTIVQLTS